MIANLIQVEFGRANDWPLGAALAVTTIVLVGLISVLVVLGARAAVARVR
jgi:spermidine/putrescine transport system permease protein